MKIGLIFTNDWELFGDGSGSYWDVQHNPMLKLLDVMNNSNSKITIMAEVGQQFKHKSDIENKEFIKISNAWEELLKQAMLSGHDVQLHIHPQWLDAKFVSGKWQLNNTKWSIAKHSEQEIYELLSKGKNYLESFLKNINPDYKCNCFRAGAYYIEPSEIVIKILKQLDFICDTSVTKGYVSDNNFNFSNAHSNILPYFVSSDIKYQSKEKKDLLEMPIYSKISFDSMLLKKFLPKLYYLIRYKELIPNDEIEWAFKRDKLKNTRYPKENRLYKQNQKKDLRFYLKHILSKSVQQLDYDYIYPTEFVKIIKNIFKEDDLKKIRNQDIILPVVASGHVKDLPDTKNIEKIIKLLKQEFGDDLIYWTLSDAAKYIKANNLF